MTNYEKFIVRFWPQAVALGLKSGLHPHALFAVAGKESSGGVSYAARRRNNFFGLGAGKMVFATPAACLDYFADLMARKYATGCAVSGNPLAFAAWFTEQSPYLAANAPAAERAKYKKDIPVLWHTAARFARKHGLRLVPVELLAQTLTPTPRS